MGGGDAVLVVAAELGLPGRGGYGPADQLGVVGVLERASFSWDVVS